MDTVFLDRASLDRGDLDLAALEQAAERMTYFEQTRPGEVVERIRPVQAVITNKVVLDADAIAAASRLKAILVAATGVNNVDVEAARRAGITVMNCRAYGTDAVAQHTILLMLCLLTSHHAYAQDVRGGEWSRSSFFCLLGHPIREAAGKTLGIVGYGTLGRRVAELAEAFGMRVRVSERPGGGAAEAGGRPRRVPFEQLAEEADVLSLHCPLTPETEGLINADVLARMASDAVLVNTARGGLVREQDLLDALRAGAIAGAAVDVVSEEPPPADHALVEAYAAGTAPNLLVTPHCAWGSREARQRVVDQLAEGLVAYQRGEPIREVT